MLDIKIFDGSKGSVKQEEGMCGLFPYFSVIFGFGTVLVRLLAHQFIEYIVLSFVVVFSMSVVFDIILFPILFPVNLGFFSSSYEQILFEILRLLGMKPMGFFVEVFCVLCIELIYSESIRDLLILQEDFPEAADIIEHMMQDVHCFAYFCRKFFAIRVMMVVLNHS